MEVYIFFFILGLMPVLWIFSLLTLRKWQFFFRFLWINALAVISYSTLIIFSGLSFFGHDEYGLKKVFLFLMTIGFHTIIGFTIALYYKYIMSKK